MFSIVYKPEHTIFMVFLWYMLGEVEKIGFY